MAECLGQIVPNRWASICVYTRGDKGSCVGCRSQMFCMSLFLKKRLAEVVPDVMTEMGQRAKAMSFAAEALEFGHSRVW